MNKNNHIYEDLTNLYQLKKDDIEERLNEFKEIRTKADKYKIFQELCFCILSSGVGPKVAERSINNLGDALYTADQNSLFDRLKETHKYPDKASYLITTRNYLNEEFNLDIRKKLDSFDDMQEKRDFVANNKNIKGIGYVQASHFLRNIGYFGYSILDKNIIKTLNELGVIENIKPATSKKRYLEIEEKVKILANDLDITIDEIDLLLWCRKTGHIPR